MKPSEVVIRGKILRSMYEESAVSWDELGEMAGYSGERLRALSRQPSVNVRSRLLLGLAKALDCPVEEIEARLLVDTRPSETSITHETLKSGSLDFLLRVFSSLSATRLRILQGLIAEAVNKVDASGVPDANTADPTDNPNQGEGAQAIAATGITESTTPDKPKRTKKVKPVRQKLG